MDGKPLNNSVDVEHNPKNQPTISFLLPAKDSTGTIKGAIESCLGQFGSDPLEVVLVVDDTEIATCNLVESLNDTRIRIHKVKSGSSLASKLNSGLRECKGVYVARMDADDICLPWRIVRQKRVMLRQNCDAVFSSAVIFGTDLRPIPFLPQIPITLHAAELALILSSSNPLIHPSFFCKREVLLEVGGYREVVAEDWDLWIRLILSGKQLVRDYLPSILYRYSKRSMSHNSEHRARVEADENLSGLHRRLAEFIQEQAALNSPNYKLLLDKGLSWRAKLSQFSLNMNN